jgi:CDP-glucose 4,6-dehydratase
MGAINMRQFLESFHNKRVFITGHTGFKGTWLTFLLKELGAEVMGFALPPEPGPSHFKLLGMQDRINHVLGDIRDAANLNAAMQSFQPEIVFHLAAQALVKKSYADPALTFDTNVMGSVNLLDAVRECSTVRSLVYITSDKCYENFEWVWGYRENDKLGGRDPYSASKAAAEIVFFAYARSYYASRTTLGAATARAGNVIGGGDWAEDRIVPDCIRAIENGLPIKLRNPNATRPWQHVLEPLSGYILLAAKLYEQPKRYGGSWNFGPSTSEVRTAHDVAKAITKILGRGNIEIIGSQDQHHEANLLQLNCDKAQQDLGWSSRWGVEETFSATAEWYKTVMAGGRAEDITRTQLKVFFSELL